MVTSSGLPSLLSRLDSTLHFTSLYYRAQITTTTNSVVLLLGAFLIFLFPLFPLVSPPPGRTTPSVPSITLVDSSLLFFSPLFSSLEVFGAASSSSSLLLAPSYASASCCHVEWSSYPSSPSALFMAESLTPLRSCSTSLFPWSPHRLPRLSRNKPNIIYQLWQRLPLLQ